MKQIPNKRRSKNPPIKDNIKNTTFTYFGNITQNLITLFRNSDFKKSYNTENTVSNKVKPEIKSNVHYDSKIYKIE